METKPEKIYKYYTKYIINKIKSLPLTHQIDILNIYDVHLIVLDFDGIILKLYPIISTIKHDYYCIYDLKECKKKINEILNNEDIKLILSNTLSISEEINLMNDTILLYNSKS